MLLFIFHQDKSIFTASNNADLGLLLTGNVDKWLLTNDSVDEFAFQRGLRCQFLVVIVQRVVQVGQRPIWRKIKTLEKLFRNETNCNSMLTLASPFNTGQF